MQVGPDDFDGPETLEESQLSICDFLPLFTTQFKREKCVGTVLQCPAPSYRILCIPPHKGELVQMSGFSSQDKIAPSHVSARAVKGLLVSAPCVCLGFGWWLSGLACTGTGFGCSLGEASGTQQQACSENAFLRHRNAAFSYLCSSC